jgi:hypothetical protein
MIPHRTKLRELIIEEWKRYFQILKRDLAVCFSYLFRFSISYYTPIQDAAGRISFTTDTWSDQNRRSYLAITAHWIAKVKGTTALQSKVALIAFHRLSGRHDGKTLARTVLHLMDRANITMKVSAQWRAGSFGTYISDNFQGWPFHDG